MGVPASTRRLRFGVFEADLSSRELYKRGRPVHLQDQPFQILLMLLERAGEVVTRADLRKALWPADTFVDFDEGLNTAIKKLRNGLGDLPDNPTFIETVPRRGYRFIAPITAVEVVSTNDPGQNTPDLPAFVTVSPAGVRETVKPPIATPWGWKMPLIFCAMFVAALLVLS